MGEQMAALTALLRQRDKANADEAGAIDVEIASRYETTRAIFVLDTSGFSRTTAALGIAHFLSLFQRICDAALPCIERHSGTLMKQDADNLFAVFDDSPAAIDCALDVIHSLRDLNATRDADRQLSVSIGVGHGRVLMLDRHELFGDEMNRACKLGEDLAEPMEVLLTDAAWQRLPVEGRARWKPRRTETSGMLIPAWEQATPG